MDQELKQALAEINLRLDLIENRICAMEKLQERFQKYYLEPPTHSDYLTEEIRKIALGIK